MQLSILSELVTLRECPKFEEDLSDLQIQEGEQVEFVCKLHPTPFNDGREEVISVHWQRYHELIKDTPQTRVIRKADGVNMLIVPDVQEADSGTFHCVAKNEITGEGAVTTCELNVYAVQPGAILYHVL